MELKIEVTTSDSCKVIVQDQSEYLQETFDGTVKGQFKFSDTVSIDVLQINKPTEIEYKEPVFTLHTNNNPIEIPVTFDGWFDIVHIVLPSDKWFNNELSKQEGSAIGLYTTVYYSDGNKVYKYNNQQIEEVSVQDIAEINTIDTTISRTEEDFVSICYLRKCYINLCKQLFEDRAFNECFAKEATNSELVFKRDLVWMAINVIKYLTECEQLAEVARLIDIIKGCNGLCVTNNNTSKVDGCGCR